MRAKNIFASCLICASLMLAGCDSEQKKGGLPNEPSPFIISVNAILGVLKPSVAPVDPRKRLTRKAIDASPVAVLFASIETRNAFATLSRVGENRDVVTWATADGIGLSYKQGVLVATRGLGPDLMAADVSNVLPALKSGQGTALRIHDYLNGEDQIIRRSFHCVITTQGHEVLNIIGLSTPTRRVSEICRNPDTTIENQYWITRSGRIVQSRQWIGSGINYVFTQQLSR